MRMTVGLLVLLAAAFFLSCDETNNHFSAIPEELKEVPKKCLDDPCLPGCPVHDFVCPPEDDPPRGWR